MVSFKIVVLCLLACIFIVCMWMLFFLLSVKNDRLTSEELKDLEELDELQIAKRDFTYSQNPPEIKEKTFNSIEVQDLINKLKPEEIEQLHDKYHSFQQLYEFRMVYNAALVNEWALGGKHFVQKSLRHNDGELCFGGDWFIVVALLPTGLISNHYHIKHWDLFKCNEVYQSTFQFDGHTATDVLVRLKTLCLSQ